MPPAGVIVLVDHLTVEARSELMKRVRRSGTAPELVVRRIVHGFGYRYRLNRKDLPGKPDLVLAKRRAIIFVHGCFWHQHPSCAKARPPKSNAAIWKTKFERNVVRDKKAIIKLKAAGWRCLVVWECETKNISKLTRRLVRFLG